MRAREAATASAAARSLRGGCGVVVIAHWRICGERRRGVIRADDSHSSQGRAFGAPCVIAHTRAFTVKCTERPGLWTQAGVRDVRCGVGRSWGRLPAPALPDVDL